MTMLNSVLKIWLLSSTYPASAADFEAYRQYHTPTSLYLTELEGWYEEINLSLQTQPKLLGNGSYITGVQNDNKTITLTFTSSHTNELALRAYVDVLRTHILSQLTSIKTSVVEIQFYHPPHLSDPHLARKETINCHLISVSDVTEYQEGTDLVFTLEFVAVDPTITVTIPSP